MLKRDFNRSSHKSKARRAGKSEKSACHSVGCPSHVPKQRSVCELGTVLQTGRWRGHAAEGLRGKEATGELLV